MRWFFRHETGSAERVLHITAIVISISALLTLFADNFGVFKQRPFRDVRLLSIEAQGQKLHIRAAYEKLGCQLARMVVFGVGVGDSLVALDFLPYRGPNVELDRIEGRQVMDITVDTLGILYDQIEIRTRHDCDGRRVDSLFLRVDIEP